MPMPRAHWLHLLAYSTIAIRQLDRQGSPYNISSGCIIKYRGKRILMTMTNSSTGNSNWNLELEGGTNTGTIGYQIGSLNVLSSRKFAGPNDSESDFSFCVLPDDLCPLLPVLNKQNEIIDQVSTVILTTDFSQPVDPNLEYGFCGHSNFNSSQEYRTTYVRTIVTGLQFMGIVDGLLKFSLPSANPDIKQLSTLTGAPVLDSNGRLVSLLCPFTDNHPFVTGILLSQYKTVFDQQC